ncbi:MAG: hypothetical protein GF383_14270 [Candidatus Lokiarchaeota archaeon]|nr:hypothetical protein [Candidatus Lokiarchaeota archaeon]MBD3342533.1 hypothetical protein [Candidatus Lokiarchaeota archaeon]
MPTNSDFLEDRQVIGKLMRIADALKEFDGKFEKKFNFTKLLQFLQISGSHKDQLLELLLRFQSLFQETLSHHGLESYKKDGFIYLKTKPRAPCPPPYFCLEPEDLDVINDFIYAFKNVRRGKGFHLDGNGSSLVEKLKKLYKGHPYLFYKNGGDLAYPSPLCVELGEKILSYNKTNKGFSHLKIHESVIEVIQDE